jgi:hypothetical protein
VSRPEFRPTDVETAAIRAGEERWKSWGEIEQVLTSGSPVDSVAIGNLGTVARKMLVALDKFRSAPMAGHTATLLRALQDIDLPIQPQEVQRQRIAGLYKDLQLIVAACGNAASGPGVKISHKEARFVWCAADAWCQMVGVPPTAKGRFHKTIAFCAHDPSLRELSPERVGAALARWKQFATFPG